MMTTQSPKENNMNVKRLRTRAALLGASGIMALGAAVGVTVVAHASRTAAPAPAPAAEPTDAWRC
jgi:hypothetical protein